MSIYDALRADDEETLKWITNEIRTASPVKARKLRYIARHIAKRTPRVYEMRKALFQYRMDGDLDNIKDVEDWVLSHENYQTPQYEKNG